MCIICNIIIYKEKIKCQYGKDNIDKESPVGKGEKRNKLKIRYRDFNIGKRVNKKKINRYEVRRREKVMEMSFMIAKDSK